MNLYKSMKLRVQTNGNAGVEFLFINDAGSDPRKTFPIQVNGINMNYAGTTIVQYERATGVNEHSRVDVKVGDTWLK